MELSVFYQEIWEPFCLWTGIWIILFMNQLLKVIKSIWMGTVLKVKELLWEEWIYEASSWGPSKYLAISTLMTSLVLWSHYIIHKYVRSWRKTLLHSLILFHPVREFWPTENQLRQVFPNALPPENIVHNSHAKNASKRETPACLHPHNGVWPR